MRSFFQPSEFSKFSQAINQYCADTMKFPLPLTENEIAQLSWYMDSKVVTPEASERDIQDKLHFEIKRGLARRYGFELLLRGDEISYLEFIASQKDELKLSREDFNHISKEAKALSNDQKLAIKATCFLTISEKAKIAAVGLGHKSFSNDSEEFLSQLCGDAFLLNSKIFPIFNELTQEQLLLLQKAFWPNMHFRHMMFTEGGINMTKTFSEGVLSGQFTADDFKIWQWRWLTNLFGFQLGQGAKCFDSQMLAIAKSVFNALENILKNPRENTFLKNYLLMRAKVAGFEKCSDDEKMFLGHLTAYFHQINILTPELGAAVFAGYHQFCKENAENNLAQSYVVHCMNPSAVTSTYVPAVINNAFLLLKKSIDEKDALILATQFMCQFLHSLYACPVDHKISCMDIAKDSNLQPILEDWLKNHNDIQFEFSNGVAKKIEKAFPNVLS